MSITWDPRVLHARDMSDLYDSLCTQPTQKWFFSDFFASRFALQYCLEAFALQMVFLAKETVVLGARKILHLSGKEVSLSLEPWTYSFRKTVLYAKAFFITLAATFLLLFGYEPLAWYNLGFQYNAGLYTDPNIAEDLNNHQQDLEKFRAELDTYQAHIQIFEKSIQKATDNIQELATSFEAFILSQEHLNLLALTPSPHLSLHDPVAKHFLTKEQTEDTKKLLAKQRKLFSQKFGLLGNMVRFFHDCLNNYYCTSRNMMIADLRAVYSAQAEDPTLSNPLLWFTEESVVSILEKYPVGSFLLPEIQQSHETLRNAITSLTKTASTIPHTLRYGSKEAQAAIENLEKVIATLPLSKFSKLL